MRNDILVSSIYFYDHGEKSHDCFMWVFLAEGAAFKEKVVTWASFGEEEGCMNNYRNLDEDEKNVRILKSQCVCIERERE